MLFERIEDFFLIANILMDGKEGIFTWEPIALLMWHMIANYDVCSLFSSCQRTQLPNLCLVHIYSPNTILFAFASFKRWILSSDPRTKLTGHKILIHKRAVTTALLILRRIRNSFELDSSLDVKRSGDGNRGSGYYGNKVDLKYLMYCGWNFAV